MRRRGVELPKKHVRDVQKVLVDGKLGEHKINLTRLDAE